MKNSMVAYQTRLFQLMFGLVLVFLGVYAVKSMSHGSARIGKMLGGGILIFAVILALDRRYWIILPFLYHFGVSVPGLPFNSTEIGCLTIVATHFVRLGLHRDRPTVWNRPLLLSIPVLAWIAFVFSLNPVGMNIFGSSTMGGRFYFDIVLAYFTLFSLASLRFDEHDAKLLFYILVIGMVFALLRGVVFPQFDPDDAGTIGEEFSTRSTRYAFIPCANLFMLLICRYGLSEVLHSLGLTFLSALLVLGAIYSGKRRTLVYIAGAPFIRSLITGKDRLLTSLFGFLAAFFLVFAVLADGTFISIPRSAKRALAVLVPKYRNQGFEGYKDKFREQVHRRAYTIIKDSPWVGRKGFAMSREETIWMYFGRGRTGLYGGHAYSGNWHSLWLAFAADFGLPGAFLWGLCYLSIIFYAAKAVKIVTQGVWPPICCMYFSISFLIGLLFSWTSGHSAQSILDIFWIFGLLLAVVRGYQESHGMVVR